MAETVGESVRKECDHMLIELEAEMSSVMENRPQGNDDHYKLNQRHPGAIHSEQDILELVRRLAVRLRDIEKAIPSLPVASDDALT